jgi:hypothetical protein
VTPSWNGVKNKRHLSIPSISPEDGITQGEFLETISSLQSNCNKVRTAPHARTRTRTTARTRVKTSV